MRRVRPGEHRRELRDLLATLRPLRRNGDVAQVMHKISTFTV